MLTPIAFILIGLWLILDSNEAPSTILTLIFGLAVGIIGLVLLFPLARGYSERR